MTDSRDERGYVREARPDGTPETGVPPNPDATTLPMAVWSLVLGILGLVMCGLFAAIPAVICGHKGMARVRQSGGALKGGDLALVGLILGYVAIGLTVLMVPLMAAIAIPSFVKARDVSQHNACVNNLRQIDAAKEQTALEHSYTNGAEIPAGEVSEYLRDGLDGLTCPKGGVYTVNPLGQDPECSVHGSLSSPKD